MMSSYILQFNKVGREPTVRLHRAERHRFELCRTHYFLSIILVLHTDLNLWRRGEKNLKNEINQLLIIRIQRF